MTQARWISRLAALPSKGICEKGACHRIQGIRPRTITQLLWIWWLPPFFPLDLVAATFFPPPDIVHAADRAVGRAVFPDAKSAADALRDLSKRITAAGLPAGTIPDPRRADSVLVPIGNGWAVYEIKDNGTAILRTVLGAN